MRHVTLLAAILLAGFSYCRADEAANRAGPANVLVVYRSDDADRDRNGTPDSEEVARYYAARRGVPAGNLAGFKLGPLKRDYQMDYVEFHERLLKPLAAKLAEKQADGKLLSARICYIAVCPGVPTYVDTKHKQPEGEAKRDWFAYTARRSLDQWLISIDANVKAGVDAETGAPGQANGRPLGARMSDLVLPTYGQTAADQAKSFRQLRADSPERYGFYLVTRLGDTPEHGRDAIDGSLYAERHLRLPAPDEKAAWTPTIWLDQKYKFAGDHVASMAMTVAVVRGAAGSPFAAGEGLRRPWPVVIDREEAEIGSPVEGGLHRPAASVKIVKVEKIERSGKPFTVVTLEPPGKAGRAQDVPAKAYFVPGWPAGNGKSSGRVVGVHATENAVVLEGDVALEADQSLTSTWPGTFPSDDCFIFYGFYGLGKYEDVFKFPAGALGVHVDSSCMTWARGAMSRGIAATFGVTSEPLSVGIPHGHFLLAALGGGADWAEAVYASLRLGQRWCGVAFGDPLYAPFRSRQIKDTAAPKPAAAKVTADKGKATISIELADDGEDASADVALFKLEYGPGKDYGQTIEFYDWPEPDKGRGVKGRRFGYSRRAEWHLTGLAAGRTHHFRITARDPAGNQTTTEDGEFTP